MKSTTLISTSCLVACDDQGVPAPDLPEEAPSASGVCPPFPLRDLDGMAIDPVTSTAPYSPRQTSGAEGCHDYDKVTEGFHFTQGRGEEQPESWRERFAWTLYPGNYGGNWCSPSPLYRALAPKRNAVEREIDMTSFDFVTAPRITPPPKHIWTFYDQDREFWNHYGELNLFSVQDEPTDVTLPALFRYKGRIFPGNRVHSAWVGYEEDGTTALGQVRMKDFFGMWTRHRASPETAYPALASIQDDDGDGLPEVNRPEEIDALLSSTREHLAATGFSLDKRTLVWVSDDRAWTSSTDSRLIPKEDHEASPYASVYKFSHDVAPARAALGSGGCTDCHAPDAGFFDRPVLERAFGEDGRAVWTSGAPLLGATDAQIRLGAFREARLKPALYGLLALAASLLAGLGLRAWTERAMGWGRARSRAAGGLLALGAVGMGVVVMATPGLAATMTVSRFTLDSAHFPVAVGVLLLGVLASTAPSTPPVARGLGWAGLLAIAVTVAAGGLMLVDLDALEAVRRFAYTGFDLGLAVSLVLSAVQLGIRLLGRGPLPGPISGEATTPHSH